MSIAKIILLDKLYYVPNAPEYPHLESLVCLNKCDGECGDVCPVIQSAKWINESKEETYNQALTEALKDKVKFNNVHEINELNINGDTKGYFDVIFSDGLVVTYEQGKLYDIPEGYQVETELRDADEVYFKLKANSGDYWNHHFHYYDSGRKTIKKEFQHLYSFAILKPITKQEPEPCPNCQEIIEECACIRNKCHKCGNPVGNITFTVCDDCWDKSYNATPVIPESGLVGKDNDAINSINSIVTCPHSGLLCYDPLCGKTTAICNNSHCFSLETKLNELAESTPVIPEKKALLEDIDDLLCLLENTAHGEEGKQITEMRHRISSESTPVIEQKEEMTAKYFLESKGYEFPDKDFWMEEYITEHKFKDIIKLMEEYAESKQLTPTKYIREIEERIIWRLQAEFKNDTDLVQEIVSENFEKIYERLTPKPNENR